MRRLMIKRVCTTVCLVFAASVAHAQSEDWESMSVAASAYNSLPSQTANDPTIAAWGDKLKPGMTRRQVAFVMGEPVIQDPFDDTKWVYLYSIDVPGVFSQESRLILFFDENDLLTVISGDYAPSDATAEQEEAADAASNSPS